MWTVGTLVFVVGGCRESSPGGSDPSDPPIVSSSDVDTPPDDTGTPHDSASGPVVCGRFSGRSAASDVAGATLSGGRGLGMTVDFGDLDADGTEDLLVGAPGDDGGAGAVYGWTGAVVGDVDTSSATVTLTGEAGGKAGTAIAWVGDWTGDGVSDLFVGAPGYDRGRGRLYFVPGPIAGSIDLSSALAIDGFEEAGVPSGIGNRLQAIGDLTGDGLPDLLIGGDEMAYTWVLSGPPASGGVIGDLAAAVLVPEAPVGRGESYAHGVGDLDGDGVDDVLVGAWGSGAGGRAWLLRGPVEGVVDLDGSADLTIDGGPDAINLGVQVAGGHDVTGDGVGDLWVGDIYAADARGEVYLFDGTRRGQTDPSTADARVRGEAPDDLSGMVVDPGDLDGDGFGDVVVGSTGARVEVDITSGTVTSSTSFSVPGGVYVLYGPFGAATIGLASADAAFGGGMPGGIAHRLDADIDRDGCRDLWIGAPTASRAYGIPGPSTR